MSNRIVVASQVVVAFAVLAIAGMLAYNAGESQGEKNGRLLMMTGSTKPTAKELRDRIRWLQGDLARLEVESRPEPMGEKEFQFLRARLQSGEGIIEGYRAKEDLRRMIDEVKLRTGMSHRLQFVALPGGPIRERTEAMTFDGQPVYTFAGEPIRSIAELERRIFDVRDLAFYLEGAKVFQEAGCTWWLEPHEGIGPAFLWVEESPSLRFRLRGHPTIACVERFVRDEAGKFVEESFGFTKPPHGPFWTMRQAAERTVEEIKAKSPAKIDNLKDLQQWATASGLSPELLDMRGQFYEAALRLSIYRCNWWIEIRQNAQMPNFWVAIDPDMRYSLYLDRNGSVRFYRYHWIDEKHSEIVSSSYDDYPGYNPNKQFDDLYEAADVVAKEIEAVWGSGKPPFDRFKKKNN